MDALNKLADTIQDLVYMAQTYSSLKTFLYISIIVIAISIFINIAYSSATNRHSEQLIKEIEELKIENNDQKYQIEKLITRIDNILIIKNDKDNQQKN